MALISDLPNATPQKSDLMEIQNGQTSSNNSSVGQLMQLSASENLAPAYDANAGVYAVGDFVSYDGTLYQCNTAIATPEAFDATKWDAVKVTEISSGASVIQLTQAEYTALSTAEKMNGSIYKLTDKAVMLCLDEEYHPVKELTTVQYEALTTAEQNNGTIYIQTDAETTGEDISVSSTDARTIDEGIADANGQIIDYATWQTMTPQEQAAAGKVYVPDFPTATPNATEIPMSSSDSTSVAAAVSNSMFSIVRNDTTYTFRVSEWRSGDFYSFLLYGGTNASKPFFYICFISSTGGIVSITPVVPFEGATISGTFDLPTKTITITSDKTIWGGINVIICRRTEN